MDSSCREIYEAIKDSMSLEEAISLREEFILRSRNSQEDTEELCLKFGKSSIILEGLGKLKEVDEDIHNRLYEVGGVYRLR